MRQNYLNNDISTASGVTANRRKERFDETYLQIKSKISKAWACFLHETLREKWQNVRK